MRFPQFGKEIDRRPKEMNRNDDSSKQDCAQHKHIFDHTDPSNTAQPTEKNKNDNQNKRNRPSAADLHRTVSGDFQQDLNTGKLNSKI